MTSKGWGRVTILEEHEAGLYGGGIVLHHHPDGGYAYPHMVTHIHTLGVEQPIVSMSIHRLHIIL